MTVARGLLITLACGLGFGILGTAVGMLLGSLAPDYYRAVLHIPPGTPVDPTQVGLGLGLTQGVGAGLVVGLVVVVAVAWYQTRLAAVEQSRSDE